MARTSIKIVGASGQGIISIAKFSARSEEIRILRVRYREYPTLIKAGMRAISSTFPTSLSQQRDESKHTLALDHHGLELNMEDLKEGGLWST